MMYVIPKGGGGEKMILSVFYSWFFGDFCDKNSQKTGIFPTKPDTRNAEDKIYEKQGLEPWMLTRKNYGRFLDVWLQSMFGLVPAG
jgi:hypothetical protein